MSALQILGLVICGTAIGFLGGLFAAALLRANDPRR